MFAKIAAVFTLLPKVIAVVQLVEELLSPSTPGETKKNVALDALRNAGVPEKWIPIADGLIDTVVAVLNAVGILGRSSGEEPPVAPEELSPTAASARAEREVAVTDDVFNDFLKRTE